MRRCFWCPLRYSNGEILGNFIWFCNSYWGQFGTWKIWLFVPKWGGQREGRWEFALHVFRVSFILLWYHTFFEIGKHFDPRRSLSANNISVNVHLSWIWFRGVLALWLTERCVEGGLVGKDWSLNCTGLTYLNFLKLHQIELIVTRNLSNEGNWLWISLLNLNLNLA